MTKADNKKYCATLIPNHITMATMIKVFEFFLKRVCWVRLFIEISACACLEVSSDLSGTGFVSYVCLFVELSCSLPHLCPFLLASVLLHSPHGSLVTATPLSPLLLSPTRPPISGHCFPSSSAARLQTQQHPSTSSCLHRSASLQR